MTEQTKSNSQMGKIMLFISGIGVLGLAATFLIFGQTLFGDGDGDSPVKNVQVTPADPSDQRVNKIIEDADLAGATKVDEVAPTFYLDDETGTQHSLEAFKGQPVIVNFWATWCAPCRVEMPEFEQALNDYADENLVILGVNREEEVEIVEQFFADEGLFDDELGNSFFALFDSTATVAEAYGVFNMPTTYFINAEGVVTAVHRGPLARVQLEDYMELTLE